MGYGKGLEYFVFKCWNDMHGMHHSRCGILLYMCMSGMGRLHVKRNRLRFRALQGFTIAITITITAILDVIDYDCDYIGM